MSRAFDVVLYGATGFTGRQAAATFSERVGDRLRWAVAGRNAAKLEALAEGLTGAPGIVVADALDPSALATLAASTRVVLSTAGPFARFGDGMVEACVEHGTHYVDITGETPWVRRMIDAHHERAKQSGTRIVPCCGFDSVPSDLSAWFMAQKLREAGTGAATIEAVFTARGGFNGGTIASAMHMMADPTASAQLDQLRLLNPVGQRDPLPGEADVDSARYHPELERWTAPFFMAPVNTRVVRRSAALLVESGLPYGTTPVYNECLKAPSRLAAHGIAWGQHLGPRVLASARMRSLAQQVLPDPGEGPSDAVMDGGFVAVDLFATGEDGTRLRGRFEASGDPGNRVTVAMLTECALALAEDLDSLPDAAGVITPATAFGAVLHERLEARGMHWTLRPPG